MRHAIRLITISALACTALPAFAGSSTYCGPQRSKMASVGDSSSSVQMKCGAPMNRAYSGTTCTWGVDSATCKPTEVWTYNTGPDTFLQLLVFSGTTLVAIKDGDRVSD